MDGLPAAGSWASTIGINMRAVPVSMPAKVASDRRPSLAGAWNTAATCCFSQENECVPAGSVKSAEPLDIGGFQYPSVARSRSALLQALDSSDVFGSPTWARTRDLRINSRPLDLPANRHECCAFRVVVSNISCLLRPSRARGRPSLKHWILEASGGSLHTRGRASRCDREGVGGLRQDWLEAPHGASLSTRRKPIARREGRVGASRGRREPT